MTTGRAHKDIWKFRALQFLYYATFSFYISYYTVYLTDTIGATTGEIGTVAAISCVVTFMAQNFWGRVCDRVGNPRKVVLCLYVVSAAIIAGFSLVTNKYVLLGLIMLKAFFEPPLVTLCDSWAGQYSAANCKHSYGSIRAYGSVGLSLTAIGMFAFLRMNPDVSIKILFRGYPVLFALSFIIAMTIDFRPAPKERTSFMKAVPQLMRNRDYVVFLASLTLVMMAFNMVSLFQSNRVAAAGGGLAQMCLPWFFSGASEIPVLFMSRWLNRKFGMEKLMIFAFCMFVVRVTLMMLATQVWMVYAANALNGITFGICLPIIVTYITSISPEGFKASSLSLASATYSSAAGIMGSILAGWISEKASMQAAGIVGVCMCVCGLVIFTVHSLRKRRLAM